MKRLFDASFWTDLFESAKMWLIEDLPGLLIIIIVFFIAFKIIRFLLKRLSKSMIKHAEKRDNTDSDEAEKRIDTLISIMHSIIKIILWVILIMTALQKIGINIGPFLAGAGIVGLAVGFGAQQIVKDFISGFFIILENHIRKNDIAIINGTGGMVEEIEFRTTTLRDFSGVVHTFQNGKINQISNMTKEWSAMVFDIGVAYKEDPRTVMKIMKEVADDLQKDPEFGSKILEPIEIFGIDEFGDSAIIIKARLKTKPIQQWTIGRQYKTRLKYAFDKHNIEIPFPHTTVYWGEEIKPLHLELNKKVAEKSN